MQKLTILLLVKKIYFLLASNSNLFYRAKVVKFQDVVLFSSHIASRVAFFFFPENSVFKLITEFNFALVLICCGKQ